MGSFSAVAILRSVKGGPRPGGGGYYTPPSPGFGWPLGQAK